MKLKKIFGVTVLAGTCLLNSNFALAQNDRETINQVALLQSLTLGDFEGSITVKEWKTFGDTGIGTFDGLNGELVALDGIIYQGDQNCTAHVMKDTDTIPFSNITFFEKDFSIALSNIDGKAALESKLGECLKKEGENNFYMVKIPAEYAEILIRSEAKQSKPYPTLVQALEKTQKEVTLTNVRGTIVGLYCPTFMSSLNSVGWHFHFISEDKKFAGHVLNMKVKSGEAQFDKTEKFAMRLPNNKEFQNLNFSKDLSEDIRKAENDTNVSRGK